MEIYNFFLIFLISKNILRNYVFEKIYEIAKTITDSEFINQFISIYSNHFDVKSVKDDKILIFIDKQPLTNETILKQYTKHLDPKIFMKHQNLKFNPTKYACLNSWFGLKGLYEYEFLKSFSEKFNLKDYPDFKKYVSEHFKEYILKQKYTIEDIDIDLSMNLCKIVLNYDNVKWYDYLEFLIYNQGYFL